MLRVSESRVIDVTFQQIQKYEKGASKHFRIALSHPCTHAAM
jgi:hypothetical protein